jgi:hypothetical protein
VIEQGTPSPVSTSDPSCDRYHTPVSSPISYLKPERPGAFSGTTIGPTNGPTVEPTLVSAPVFTGHGSQDPGVSVDAPLKPTSEPTVAPVVIPVSPSLDVSVDATPKPTSEPFVAPVVIPDSPSLDVSVDATVKPTGVSTVAPVVIPESPSLDVPLGQAGCEEAWVYCPGRSTCFNDSGFNGGVIATNKWGWSIVFDPNEDDLVADCDILIGATDCDLNTATKVGTFQMRSNFGHFCMADYGYAATSYSFYSGTCEGNDSGVSLFNGQCSPNDIAANAALPATYPLSLFNKDSEVNFTMDSSDPINTASTNWPASHQLFPITAKSYVSAFACVVPDPENVFTGLGGSGVLWNP